MQSVKRKTQNNDAKQSGYTLMEMVVAIAIFVIVMTAITGVFLAILRVQRKTAAMQAVQQDARWAMETMARYARMDRVRYCGPTTFIPCHCDSPCWCPFLGSIKFSGVPVLFLENIYFAKIDTKLKMYKAGAWHDITPAKVEVVDLRFYISPKGVWKDNKCYSPYDPKGPDEQSRVTILMKTRYAGARPTEEEVMTLQTTVSTRAYTR